MIAKFGFRCLVAGSLLIGMTQFTSLATADSTSRGVNGIHVPAGLTGAGIWIGQVEGGRPGMLPLDPIAGNVNVSPAGVFNGASAAIGDNLWEFAETVAPIPPFAGNHAENVASVMISTNAALTGIAPGAFLQSSADSPLTSGTANSLSAKSAVAAQILELRAPTAAINMSFGISPVTPDGSTRLTQYVDWATRQFDTTYVIAADETGPGSPGSPSDLFNGINVAFSRQVGGVFRQVDGGNIFTTDTSSMIGTRRLNDILAPGRSITMDSYNTGTNVSSGTSFAAPHVTGTVALLHEQAKNKIDAGDPNFGGFPKRHEVIKAVIMNSVDKIKDDGTYVHKGNVVKQGHLLGMEKTILDTGGADWVASDAFTNSFLPLHLQMGTGQLNASRAVTQHAAGEWDPGDVPVIGWDLGVSIGAADTNIYAIEEKLVADSFVSITLAWDRIVSLNDTLVANGIFDAEVFKDTGGIPGDPTAPAAGLIGGNSGGFTFLDVGQDGMSGTMDPGEGDAVHNFNEPSEPFIDVNGNGSYAFASESFTNVGLTDLDLYLMPHGETDFSKSIAVSFSLVDSVEHIFAQIPDTGLYDIMVFQSGDGAQSSTDYGLAWWSVAVPEPNTFTLAIWIAAGCLLRSRQRTRNSTRNF